MYNTKTCNAYTGKNNVNSVFIIATSFIDEICNSFIYLNIDDVSMMAIGQQYINSQNYFQSNHK